jgi:hypothetical protein
VRHSDHVFATGKGTPRSGLRLLTVGYRGTWGEVEVDSVLPDVRLDDWDETPGVWRVIQDLIIGHRTAPGS